MEAEDSQTSPSLCFLSGGEIHVRRWMGYVESSPTMAEDGWLLEHDPNSRGKPPILANFRDTRRSKVT
jgi:hypothetical protein